MTGWMLCGDGDAPGCLPVGAAEEVVRFLVVPSGAQVSTARWQLLSWNDDGCIRGSCSAPRTRSSLQDWALSLSLAALPAAAVLFLSPGTHPQTQNICIPIGCLLSMRKSVPSPTLYTDGSHSYQDIPPFLHKSVNHSAYEYVRDMPNMPIPKHHYHHGQYGCKNGC